jgi:hypothetical protein
MINYVKGDVTSPLVSMRHRGVARRVLPTKGNKRARHE